MVNHIALHFDRDRKGADYNQLIEKSDPKSIAHFGKREKPEYFNFDWMRDRQHAENVLDFYLNEMSLLARYVGFETPIMNLQIKRFDILAIQHSLFQEGPLFPAFIVSVARTFGKKVRPDKITFTTKLAQNAIGVLIEPSVAGGQGSTIIMDDN